MILNNCGNSIFMTLSRVVWENLRN